MRDETIIAILHARHALVAASGLIAHDGKPEQAFTLEFHKEIVAIDKALEAEGIDQDKIVVQPLH